MGGRAEDGKERKNIFKEETLTIIKRGLSCKLLLLV